MAHRQREGLSPLSTLYQPGGVPEDEAEVLAFELQQAEAEGIDGVWS